MRTTLIICSLLICTALHAQSYWAQKQAGGNVDETLAIASDGAGNSYLTGYFSTSANINGTTQSVSGLTDVFITKTAENGTSNWVKSFGGSGSDRGLDVAVDESGNVYVCGFYKTSINFGGGVSISSNANSQDGFLAKFDGSGNIIWAKSFGSSGQVDQANGIAVDGSGNVIVTGQFSGDADFDGLSLSSLGGSTDVCTAKYNSSGDVQWAKKGSGDNLDKGIAVSTDAQGNAYVTGQFSGDIEFDNSYSNTIQNALFLIKYNSAGDEEWFRWAGGTDQAISSDIKVVGSSVFFVGDFGSQITFFGGSGSPNIQSNFSNAVFLASYSTSGSFGFGESMGSESPVSARGLDVNNGQIAVAGWFECTFNELSDEYGEVTFNNLGGRDVFVMRYTSSGSFQWARNFGSKQTEMAYDVALLSDGIEVVVGVFGNLMIFPVTSSMSIPGTNNVIGPNQGLTYCGDSSYGVFKRFDGPSDLQNGFAVKIIDPNRSPLDFYQHYGSGCNLDIPETCIQPAGGPMNDDCPEVITLCPGEQIMAVNQIFPNTDIGYNYNVTWSPSGSGTQVVNQEGTYTATITSEDGCYTSTASVDVELHPEPDNPLISDNVVINDMAEVPFPIIICPGETVELTGYTDAGNTYFWGGPGIGPDQSENNPITVSEGGWYTFYVENEFGCVESNFVQVVIIDVPLDLIDPFIDFDAIDDTLTLCSNASAVFTVYDIAYDGNVPLQGYDWLWTVTPDGNTSIGNSISVPATEDGWIYINVEIEKEENECETDFPVYSLSDSVYVQVIPAPEVSISLTGPNFVCPGDTVTLLLEYEGDLNLNFTPIANFGDSLWVNGPGTYNAGVSLQSENGCSASSGATLLIQEVSSPSIISSSETGIVCPGDSVLLVATAQGDVVWQGPDGPFASDSNFVYVSESGIYYIEVSYYEGCELVSNSVEISEYTTPYISGSNAVLCAGDSVEISIISSSNSDINWLPPLSGNNPFQIIDEPGVYQAEIMACGISTLATIEVDTNTFVLEIEQTDLSPVCAGDSIFVEATLGFTDYQWNPSVGTNPAEYFYADGFVQATAIDSNNCELESNILNLSFEPLPPLPDFTYDLVCEGDTQIVLVESDFNISFIDGPGGILLQTDGEVVLPDFIADTTLYVYLSSELCDGPLGTLDISPIIYPDMPMLSSNAPACTGTYLEIIVDNPAPGVVYNWTTPDMDTEEGTDVNIYIEDMSQAGLYSCYADLTGCASDTSFIVIDLFETVVVELPADTGMCNTSDIVISTNTDFTDYLWQDGSQNPTFSPFDSGQITVLTHDDNGCQSFDDMFLDIVDCDYDIPNVFSPNGDGFNDYWDFGIEDPLFYELIVFNRWGRKVFESSENEVYWNGNNYNNDKPLAEGVYYYILRFVNIDLYRYEVSGYVTILR